MTSYRLLTKNGPTGQKNNRLSGSFEVKGDDQRLRAREMKAANPKGLLWSKGTL